jgi:hypothetical protein
MVAGYRDHTDDRHAEIDADEYGKQIDQNHMGGIQENIDFYRRRSAPSR